jgi:hypothetical protein
MDYRLQGGLINSQRAPLDLPAGWAYDDRSYQGALHNKRSFMPVFSVGFGRRESAYTMILGD